MKLPKQSQSVMRDIDARNQQVSATKSIEKDGVYPSLVIDFCELTGMCPTVPFPFPPIYAGRYRTRAAGAGIG